MASSRSYASTTSTSVARPCSGWAWCSCSGYGSIAAVRLPPEGLPMTRAYNVVDADGHILEPLDLWDRYMDPVLREPRRRLVIADNGRGPVSVDANLGGTPRGP